PAIEWADRKGVSWETVKKRVQRGSGWCKALNLNEDDLLPKQYQLFKFKLIKQKKKRHKYKRNAPCYYFQQLSLWGEI
ncbi:hypothetical protein ACFQ3I_13545, partial [Entomomonas asaccharolytica]